MTKKFLLLAKTSIAITFNPRRMFSKQNSKATKGKTTGYLILALILAVYIFGFSTSTYYVLGNALNSINSLRLLIYLAIFSYTAVTLLISIISAQGYLYKSKDLPMLLSLPISQFSVLLSKFLLLYLYELLYVIMILLPAFCVYFYFAGITVLGIIGAFLCCLAAPLLPLAVGSILSFFIGLLTRRMRRKNFLTIILSLGFMVGWIILVQNSGSILEYVIANSETLQQALTKFYFPSVLVADGLDGDIIKTLLFVLVGVAALVLVFGLISRKYSDIIAIMTSTNLKKKNKAYTINTKHRSAFGAMIKKELSCYFSSSIYVMNTITGPLLLVIGSVALLFMDKEQLSAYTGDVNFGQFGVALAAVMLAFIPSISPTTCSSISLEGKKLWIYKSIPADVKDILKAKTALNLIITVPEILISSVLLSFALRLSVTDYILVVALGIVFNLFFSLTGLIINLSYPKLDFENETVVIKQSMSVFLTMLLTFGFMITTILIYVFTGFDFYIFALAVLLVVVILILLCIRILKSWGVRKFNGLY